MTDDKFFKNIQADAHEHLPPAEYYDHDLRKKVEASLNKKASTLDPDWNPPKYTPVTDYAADAKQEELPSMPSHEPSVTLEESFFSDTPGVAEASWKPLERLLSHKIEHNYENQQAVRGLEAHMVDNNGIVSWQLTKGEYDPDEGYVKNPQVVASGKAAGENPRAEAMAEVNRAVDENWPEGLPKIDWRAPGEFMGWKGEKASLNKQAEEVAAPDGPLNDPNWEKELEADAKNGSKREDDFNAAVRGAGTGDKHDVKLSANGAFISGTFGIISSADSTKWDFYAHVDRNWERPDTWDVSVAGKYLTDEEIRFHEDRAVFQNDGFHAEARDWEGALHFVRNFAEMYGKSVTASLSKQAVRCRTLSS